MTAHAQGDEDRPIFVVGVPRSGTTLLSMMLSAHSRIVIAPETHFVAHDWRTARHLDLSDIETRLWFWRRFAKGEWFAKMDLQSESLEAEVLALAQPTFAEIFRLVCLASARKWNKPRWGEKTPGHYAHLGTLFDWFPNACVVFVIRDPRAVAASTITTPWGARWVSFHARRWAEAAEILGDWQKDRRVLAIRYEDLIQDSEHELGKICALIGEPYEDRMEQRDRASVTVSGDAWHRSHRMQALEPISSASLQRWRSELSRGQVAMIEELSRPFMAHWGYQPESRQLRRSQRALLTVDKACSRIDLGLRNRFRQLGVWLRSEMVPRTSTVSGSRK